MIALYGKWIDAFPIVSIEDGLDENDWGGFARRTSAQGQRIQIVGDDIFVTDPEFIARGVKEKTANAVLIKLNQIGTVTETVQAIALCRKAGWTTSSRTGPARPKIRPRRLHGRYGRRTDQDGIGQPQRTHLQVQPPARNRGRARRLRGVRFPVRLKSELERRLPGESAGGPNIVRGALWVESGRSSSRRGGWGCPSIILPALRGEGDHAERWRGKGAMRAECAFESAALDGDAFPRLPRFLGRRNGYGEA